MADYNTNQFRAGLKILVDGEPCLMLENEFIKPGKGQAFNRVKLRNLVNGRVIDRTYKSGETVEVADVVELPLQYLYSDKDEWHFMDPESFEQYIASAGVVSDAKAWLKEQEVCVVTLHNGVPLVVEPPNFVELKVIETEPGVRGDTVAGATKSAQLETGAVVKVPLFVETGEILRIDTRTGEYVARVR